MKVTVAVLWTLLVLAASTDLFSGAHTGSLIALLSGLPTPAVERINFAVRKSAHVIEYAILSWLWFRALRGEAPLPWSLRWAVIAVAIAAAVATTDEIHQSFVASRTSSPWDVVLDTVGATLAQLALRLRLRRP